MKAYLFHSEIQMSFDILNVWEKIWSIFEYWLSFLQCNVDEIVSFPRMFFLPAIGGPQRARGSVNGSINDVEFGIAFLNATVTDSPNSDTRIIHAKITNVPRSLGKSLC